jgi:uncharacterized protein
MEKDTLAFLFASDLHGSTLCFERLLDAALEFRVDAIIIGGDLSGKYPTFVARESERWTAFFAGTPHSAVTEQEYVDLKNDIENVGSYPVLTSSFERERLATDEQAINEILLREASIRLRQWLVNADRRLSKTSIRLVMMCGNDDPHPLDKIIAQFRFVINPDTQPVKLHGHYLIGESRAALAKDWKCPRDVAESELRKHLGQKIQSIPASELRTSIFVFHSPPKDTPIDQAFAAAIVAGQPVMTSGGSEAVRDAIERYEPVVSLHGHIHEADGFCKLGRTLCLNPGSDYPRGVLRAWYVLIKGDAVIDFKAITR